MDRPLTYVDGALCIEGVALSEIAAAVGTPAYIYSKGAIIERLEALESAFSATPTQVHYAVKANSNLAILKCFAEHGAGFDIVSGGELSRVLAAGGDPGKVVFSGVGKRLEEIDFALKVSIGCFNVESRAELIRLGERARLADTIAPLSIRVNPNVDAATHPYISTGLKENKFGVPLDEARALYDLAQDHPHLSPCGIDCHIGSQITDVEPLLDALTSLLRLTDELTAAGFEIEHLDLGGGMGVRYDDETPLDFETYGAAVAQALGARELKIALEPGRAIVANAGVLLTRVEYLKPAAEEGAPNFAVVDCAMNDLIRPALYQAWHDVLPASETSDDERLWDIVGPVCESGDFLAKGRRLALAPDDLLCICSAGAYGFVQASNYNSRGRPPEILVSGTDFSVIRRRETIDDQLRLEYLP